MAALKSPVKESNLLTSNVYKFICRHLTQNAPGPILGQRGIWGLAGWFGWPPRAPLRDPWVRRQAAPVPHLSPGRKVQKTSDLPAPEYRDVAGGGGSMEGWGWSPANLSFFPFLERSSWKIQHHLASKKKRINPVGTLAQVRIQPSSLRTRGWCQAAPFLFSLSAASPSQGASGPFAQMAQRCPFLWEAQLSCRPLA